MFVKGNQKGYLGVVTVVIMAVITLAAAVSIALLGTNELIFGYQSDQSGAAVQLADACAEEAYYRLKQDPAYTGGAVPFSSGSCTVVVSGGGSSRTLTISATIQDFTRTLTADIDLVTNPSLNTDGVDLSTWNE